MRIDRPALLADVERFVAGGNGIVVGRPGVGKSYLLAELHRRLTDLGVPHLLLPVEALGVGGEEELKALLSTRGDVIEHIESVLAADSPVKGAILLDAFDAVRSEEARQRLVNLIRRLIAASRGRWNVIVTVREYDARKSPALLKLFPPGAIPTPSILQDPRIHSRHFVVPPFTPEEVDEAVAQISGLKTLIRGASKDFIRLLTVPFNLWLLEQVLSAPGKAPDITHVYSEVQLLGLFWARRVRMADNADDRELLLSKLTDLMIKDRTLTVRKDAIYAPELQRAWSDLRSAEVLVETPGAAQRVSFGHNTLFDYAVSVLQLEDLPKSVADFVAADPARPLFLRPSLTYYFTRLWHDSPDSFWRVLWSLVPYDEVHVRLVARLIPPAVIANEARRVESLAPLITSLRQRRTEAPEVAQRLLQALRMNRGASAVLWSEFCREVSGIPHRSYIWDLTTLANELLDAASPAEKKPVAENSNAIGSAVLDWIFRQRKERAEPWLDSLGAVWALPLVLKTFDTDVARSRKLVNAVLQLTQEPDFPIQYMFRLSDGVNHIFAADPLLAADVYRTIFGHKEQSDKQTSFGTPVLPLISNRRQDFDMCQYSLAQHFPLFIQSSPIEATRAAIDSINAFIIDRWIVPYLTQGKDVQDLAEEFVFRGRTVSYIAEMGHLGELGLRDDDVSKLGRSLFEFLERTAATPTPTVVLQILDLIGERSRVAYFWRELLKSGTRKPQDFAELLFELCLARPIQLDGEILYDLGEFLKVATIFYSIPQRTRIEQSLLTLPEDAESENRDRYERVAALLLACLPGDALATKEARDYRKEAEATGSLPVNEPPEGVSISSRTYTEDDWLREQGVDLVKEENAAVHAMLNGIDEFVTAWRNQTPDPEAVEKFLPAAIAARDAADRYARTTDVKILTSLWTKLAAAAATMSRSVKKLSGDAISFCREVLLGASEHEEPEPTPDRSFDFPMWSPAPRNEAALGLPWLTLTTVDKPMLDAIATLAADPVPSVRFLTAGQLFRLRWSAVDSFWEIVRKRAGVESNRSIMEALCSSLARLPKEEDDLVAAVLATIQGAGLFPPEKSDFGDTYATLVTRLALAHENEWAKMMLNAWRDSPREHAPLLHNAVFQAVLALTPDHLSDSNIRPTAIRASNWLASVLEGTVRTLRTLRPRDQSEWTEDTTKRFKDAYSLVDEVVSRLYYNIRVREGAEEIGDEAKRAYYVQVKPLLEAVTQLGLRDQSGIILAPTAHHFMQLMNEVLSYDPKGVLHMAADVAEASESAGYNIDSIAIKEVVNLVESVLADHRFEVQEGESLADLLRLLDVFAKAGWPQALQLVWRLDEVFR